MKGSINYQVHQIWNQIDGIKTSKKDTRKATQNKGANGHNVSENVHGTKYKKDVLQIAKELGSFAKKVYKIKDMQVINNDVICKFIHNKIEDGITHNSLKNYITKLEKVYIGLSKIPKKTKSHQSLYNRLILEHLRKDVDQLVPKSGYVNRAYINPESIIASMQGDNYIAAHLQLNNGLRVSEATQIYLCKKRSKSDTNADSVRTLMPF